MFVTILIGFFIGLFARWVKPGPQRLGWIMTSLVGVGGAVLATLIGQALGWYEHRDHAGFLASVGGAGRHFGPGPGEREQHADSTVGVDQAGIVAFAENRSVAGLENCAEAERGSLRIDAAGQARYE